MTNATQAYRYAAPSALVDGNLGLSTSGGRALSGPAHALYARYYDLPGSWDQAAGRRIRWGKQTADDLAAVCAQRAEEAQTGGRGSHVAANGTILEQRQIVTTHNLAVLVDALGLRDRLLGLAPDLASRTFDWIIARQAMRIPDRHAALTMVKNTAYAWRQAIFYLSFCDKHEQRMAINRLRDQVTAAGLDERFGPAFAGLAAIYNGRRFDSSGAIPGSRGRRFLGWTTGPHWVLASAASR